jgi:hypothetical protein
LALCAGIQTAAAAKLVQGPLVRRHEKLEGGKRPGDRKWVPGYAVLYKGIIYFYKENPAIFADKHVRTHPQTETDRWSQTHRERVRGRHAVARDRD